MVDDAAVDNREGASRAFLCQPFLFFMNVQQRADGRILVELDGLHDRAIVRVRVMKECPVITTLFQAAATPAAKKQTSSASEATGARRF